MECIDVVFDEFSKNDVDEFIKNELKIVQNNVISSHFYSAEKGDYEYDDKIVLSDYFKYNATCYLYLSELFFGASFKNVMILISSDTSSLNVTVNIEREQLGNYEQKKVKKYLHKLHSKYKIPKIIVTEEDSTLEYVFIIE